MTQTPLLDGEALLRYLPQRPPFLFVSRVLEVQNDSIVTEFDTHPDLDFFRGHFPGNPTTPGVVLIEAAAQSCVILLNRTREQEGGTPQLVLAAGVDEVKFRAIVPPSTTVRITCQVIVARKRFSTSSFFIQNPEGKRAAEGKISAMILPMPEVPEESEVSAGA